MARLHDPSDRLFVVGKGSTLLILALGVTVVVLIAIQSNPRILVSWHGLLHAGIAEGIDLSRIPPENPFFAGEDLPYYWLYHWLSHVLAGIAGLSPLRVFQLLGIGSLILMFVTAASIGRRHLHSTGLGLLVAAMALIGANPLGPAFAGVNRLTGRELVDRPVAVPTTYVSNQEADQLMTQPALGALYFAREATGAEPGVVLG